MNHERRTQRGPEPGDAQSYRFTDGDVVAARAEVARALEEYSSIPSDALQRREDFLRTRVFGSLGAGADVRQGFSCDCGRNIFAGSHLVIDFGCTILDAARVELGDWVILGPSVLISTINHPLSTQGRRDRIATARPVVIGDDVWIGGNATVLPGVTIGSNVVIGAGAVVTKSIPANSLALGVPARVVRTLENDAAR